MQKYPVHRTPEQGHTAACLAKALILAIENRRDWLVADAKRLDAARQAAGQPRPSSSLADYEFRLAAQDNRFLQVADEYLETGATECICPRLCDNPTVEHPGYPCNHAAPANES